MKIKEKVFRRIKMYSFNEMQLKELGKAIDLTLAEVEKIFIEEELKEMNDSGCSCGSFFNLIDGRFICNGCEEECENQFYERFISKIKGTLK